MKLLSCALLLAASGPAAEPPAPAPAADPPAATTPPNPDPDTKADPEPEPEPDPEPEPEPEPDPEPEPEPEPDPEPELEPATIGAIGGKGHTPLPAAPPPVDPDQLSDTPWRGRGWFDIRVNAIFPVAGERPARGNVIAGAGGFNFGWRITNWIGLYTGMATFVHDRAEEEGVDELGEPITITGFGRLVAFDLAVARLFLPVGRRVQPWADVGAGVGIRRGAFSERAQASGHVIGALGVDFWLGPTFTLSADVTYRMIAVDDTIGHAISTGLQAGVHW